MKVLSRFGLCLAFALTPMAALADASATAPTLPTVAVLSPAALAALDQLNARLGAGSQRYADACCKHCRTGKACGNSCISRSKSCHKGPGCACD